MFKYIKYTFLICFFVLNLISVISLRAAEIGTGGALIFPSSISIKYGENGNVGVSVPQQGEELSNFLSSPVDCLQGQGLPCTGPEGNKVVSCQRYGFGSSRENVGCNVILDRNGFIDIGNLPNNLQITPLQTSNVTDFNIKMLNPVTSTQTFNMNINAFKRAWAGPGVLIGESRVSIPFTVTVSPSSLIVNPLVNNVSPGGVAAFVITKGTNISHNTSAQLNTPGGIFDGIFYDCFDNNQPSKCIKITKNLLSNKVSFFPVSNLVTFLHEGYSAQAEIKVDCPMCIVLSPEVKIVSIGDSFMLNLTKKNGTQVNTNTQDYIRLFQGDCQNNSCVNATEVSGKSSAVKKFDVSLGTTTVNIVSLPTTTAGDYTLRVEGIESNFPGYKTVGYAKITVLENPETPFLRINWGNTSSGSTTNNPTSNVKKIVFPKQNTITVNFNVEKFNINNLYLSDVRILLQDVSVVFPSSVSEGSNLIEISKLELPKSGNLKFKISGKDVSNNNIISNELTLDLVIPADLWADKVTFSPASPTVNTPVNFSTKIKNIGGEKADNFNSFFQIANQNPNPNVMQQGSMQKSIFAKFFNKTKRANAQNAVQYIDVSPAISTGPLNAYAEKLISTSYTFTQSGTYWVRACADKRNQGDLGNIVESDEGNNCGDWASVVVGSLPDLMPGNISPTTFKNNGPSTITTSVKNVGGVATGASFKAFFQLRQQASSVFQYGAKVANALVDVDLPSFTVEALDAGQERNLTVPVTLNYPEGTYKMRLCVDKENRNGGGVITEINEENNCSADITVALVNNPLPDLVASNVSPSEAIINQSVNLTSTAKNQGLKATGGDFYGFMQVSAVNPDYTGGGSPTGQGQSTYNLFSKKAHAQGGETAGIVDLANYKFKNLEVSGTEVMTISHTFQSLGTHWVRACVDKKDSGDVGEVRESLENNNCSSWTPIIVNIGPSPDLTASYTGPRNFAAEKPDSLSGIISNVGNVNVAGNFSNFFQVADHNPNSSEGNITDLPAVSVQGLNAGANKTINYTYQFPSEGSYWIRVCADKSSSGNSGTITESNENNNCGAWMQVSVGDPNAPYGNISATNCTILEDRGECDTSLSWSTNNLIPGGNTAITTPNNIIVSEDTSGDDVAWTMTGEGSRRFYLYHNGAELTSAVAYSQCANGLVWMGDVCKKMPTKISSSISVTPSHIPFNDTATLSWSSTGATECHGGGDDFDTRGETFGSVAVGPFSEEGRHTYTLQCSNSTTNFPPASATLDVSENGGTRQPTYKEQ